MNKISSQNSGWVGPVAIGCRVGVYQQLVSPELAGRRRLSRPVRSSPRRRCLRTVRCGGSRLTAARLLCCRPAPGAVLTLSRPPNNRAARHAAPGDRASALAG